LGEPTVHRQALPHRYLLPLPSPESRCRLCQNLAGVTVAVVVVTNWMATRSIDPSPTTMPLTTGSMAYSAATMPNLSIYTNYVNVHLSIDKLDETNYDTWASYIKLWLKSQDYVDHLTQCVRNVAADEASRWLKIDAQLCIVIKSTIYLSLKQIFRAFEMCSEVLGTCEIIIHQ